MKITASMAALHGCSGALSAALRAVHTGENFQSAAKHLRDCSRRARTRLILGRPADRGAGGQGCQARRGEVQRTPGAADQPTSRGERLSDGLADKLIELIELIEADGAASARSAPRARMKLRNHLNWERTAPYIHSR